MLLHNFQLILGFLIHIATAKKSYSVSLIMIYTRPNGYLTLQ